MGMLEYLMKKYQKQLLNLQETARELGLTKKEVQALIDANEIVAVCVEKKSMITITALADFLEKGEKNTVSGQQSHGLKASEELSLSQEEKIYWIDTEEGDDDLFRGSITHTRGRYISQITIGKLPDGRRKRENKSFKSREEAEEYLQNRLNELNSIDGIKKEIKGNASGIIMTVREFTDFYLNLGLSSGTSRTIYGYKDDMKPIINAIGNKLMSDITEDDVRKLFHDFSQKYTQIVIDKKWRTSKRIFDYAYRKKYITINVFEDLKKPKTKRFDIGKKKYKAYTDLEVDRIITAARNHDTLFPILILLRDSGMRPGELRALLWENFDRDNKKLNIQSAATKKYDDSVGVSETAEYEEIISRTKSDYSNRDIILSDEAFDALIQWRKHLDKNKNELMVNSKYIFPNNKGGFMKEDALRSLLRRFIEKYKLEDINITLYRFRHTLCSKLVLDGIPISVVQKILGDNTTKVITDIYTHINNDDVVAAMEDFFTDSNREYKENKKEWVG